MTGQEGFELQSIDCGSVTADQSIGFEGDWNGMENDIRSDIVNGRPVICTALNGSIQDGLHQDVDCGSAAPECDRGYYGDL